LRALLRWHAAVPSVFDDNDAYVRGRARVVTPQQNKRTPLPSSDLADLLAASVSARLPELISAVAR
jgi:hypothetical protein